MPKRVKEKEQKPGNVVYQSWLPTYRVFAMRIISNLWFDRFILATVICNAVFLALQIPGKLEDHMQVFGEFVFSSIFYVEMVLKIAALDIQGYFEDAWNCLDFIVVMESIVSMILLIIQLCTGKDHHLSASAMSAVRLIRVLRPLKFLSKLPKLRLLIETVVGAAEPFIQISLLLFMVVLIFANFGNVYFGGKLDGRCTTNVQVRKTRNFIPIVFDYQICGGQYRCNTDPCLAKRKYNCTAQTQTCSVFPGVSPVANLTSFDTFESAFATTFQVLTFEGWLDVMFYVQDGVHFAWWIFFVLNMFVGGIMIANLYPSVMYVKLEAAIEFEKQCQQARALEDVDKKRGFQKERSQFEAILFEFQQAEQKDHDFSKRVVKDVKVGEAVEEEGGLPFLTPKFQWCYFLRSLMKQELGYWNCTFYGCIFLNLLVLSVNAEHASQDQLMFVEVVNDAFILIFALETLIRLTAFGPIGYCHNFWNVVDFFLSALGLLTFAASFAFSRLFTAARAIRIIRVFRLLRMLSILRVSRLVHINSDAIGPMDLSRLLQVLMKSGEWVFYIYFLLLVVIFLFSVLGMELFGASSRNTPTLNIFLDHVLDGQPINEDNFGFATFSDAFITVFTIFTGDRWNSIARNIITQHHPHGMAFFVVAFVVMRYFILSMVTAVVYQAIHQDVLEVLRASAAGTMASIHTMQHSVEKIHVRLAFAKWKKIRKNVQGLEGSTREVKVIIDEVLPPQDVTLWSRFVSSRKSLLIFAEKSWVRRMCVAAENSKLMQWFVHFAILSSSVAIIVQANKDAKMKAGNGVGVLNPVIEDYYHAVNDFAILAFTVEILISSIAHGFYFTENSYLKRSWSNWLDVIVTLVSAVDAAMPAGHTHVSFIICFRLMRCTRLFQLMYLGNGIEVLQNAIYYSYRPLIMSIALLFSVLFCFAVIAGQVWMGAFQYCAFPGKDASGQRLPFPAPGTMLQPSNCNYIKNSLLNYDNILNGFVANLLVFTMDGWHAVLVSATSSMGYHTEPADMHHDRGAVSYFIMLIFITILVSTLFVGTVYGTTAYFQHKADGGRTASLRLANWELYKRKLRQIIPPVIPAAPEHPLRKKIYNMIEARGQNGIELYKYAVTMVVLIDVALTYFYGGMFQYGSAPSWTMKVGMLFKHFYYTEWFLRLAAYGPKHMLNARSLACWIDILINVLMFILGTSVNQGHSDSRDGADFYKALAAIGALRVLRIVCIFPAMLFLMKTLKKSFNEVFNILVLFVLVTTIYAVVGLILFSNPSFAFLNTFKFQCQVGTSLNLCNNMLSRHLNFGSFANAFFALLGAATGEYFTDILVGLFASEIRGMKWFSVCYLITYWLIARYLLLNLMMMVVLFQYHINSPDQNGISKQEIEKFGKAWQLYCCDPPHTDLMKTSKMVPFLRTLGEPLGVEQTTSNLDARWVAAALIQVIEVEAEKKKETKAEDIKHGEPKAKAKPSASEAHTKDKMPPSMTKDKTEDRSFTSPDHLTREYVDFSDTLVGVHFLAIFGVPGSDSQHSDAQRKTARMHVGLLMLALKGSEDSSLKENYLKTTSLLRRMIPDVFYRRFFDCVPNHFSWIIKDIGETGYISRTAKEVDMLLRVLKQELTVLARQLELLKEILGGGKQGARYFSTKEQKIKLYISAMMKFRDFVNDKRSEYTEEVWSNNSMKVINNSIRHPKGKGCTAICFSKCETLLIIAFEDKTLCLWKVKTTNLASGHGKFDKQQDIKLPNRVVSLAISEDKKKIFCGDDRRSIICFKLADSRNKKVKKNEKPLYEQLCLMEGHGASVNSLCLFGAILVSVGADGIVCLWQPRAQEPSKKAYISRGVLGMGASPLFALAIYTFKPLHFDFNSATPPSFVLVGGQEAKISVLPIQSDTNFLQASKWSVLTSANFLHGQHEEAVTCFAFAWSFLYAGGSRGTVQVFEINASIIGRGVDARGVFEKLVPLQTFSFHGKAVSCMVYQCGVLFTGSHDMSILAWRPPTIKTSETPTPGLESTFSSSLKSTGPASMKRMQSLVNDFKSSLKDSPEQEKIIPSIKQDTENGQVVHAASLTCMCSSSCFIVSGDAAGQVIIQRPTKTTENVSKTPLFRPTKAEMLRKEKLQADMRKAVEKICGANSSEKDGRSIDEYGSLSEPGVYLATLLHEYYPFKPFDPEQCKRLQFSYIPKTGDRDNSSLHRGSYIEEAEGFFKGLRGKIPFFKTKPSLEHKFRTASKNKIKVDVDVEEKPSLFSVPPAGDVSLRSIQSTNQAPKNRDPSKNTNKTTLPHKKEYGPITIVFNNDWSCVVEYDAEKTLELLLNETGAVKFKKLVVTAVHCGGENLDLDVPIGQLELVQQGLVLNATCLPMGVKGAQQWDQPVTPNKPGRLDSDLSFANQFNSRTRRQVQERQESNMDSFEPSDQSCYTSSSGVSEQIYNTDSGCSAYSRSSCASFNTSDWESSEDSEPTDRSTVNSQIP